MVKASSNFFFFNGYLGYPEITLIWEIFIFNWFLARSPHFLPSLKVFKNLLRFMCYCVIYNRSCYLVKFCYWVPKLDFWVVLDPWTFSKCCKPLLFLSICLTIQRPDFKYLVYNTYLHNFNFTTSIQYSCIEIKSMIHHKIDIYWRIG